MKRILLTALLFGSSPAFAATQVRSCLANTETPGPAVAPAANVYALVSNHSTGTTPYCRLLSTMSPTAYVSTTVNGGTTYVWQTIAAALAAVAPPVNPPPVSPQPGRAQVTWSPVTTDASGLPLSIPVTYNVYRGADSTSLAKIATAATSPYLDTTVTVGTTYSFGVTAVDANGESPPAVVSVTIAAINRPASPTNVRVK